MRFARLDLGPRTEIGEGFARLDGDRAHLLRGQPWKPGGDQPTGAVVGWTEEQLRCPVVPSKIVCVGRNYAAHAKELGNEVPAEPLLFFKPPSALIGPGGDIVLPGASARVEHEGELAVVIGKRCKAVAPAEALAHVFGFTCLNDVTARDLQKSDKQWTRAKGFDTFCPAGPWVETELDLGACPVACRVNAETRQEGSTRAMIFDVPTLIAYVSRIMTLEPGDLIATGTPEGVGPLVAGDVVEVEVGGVGVLRSRVRAE
jgi:2-keto-4-pentenoate hydratase/2-oxohepta-3-ene-1,7-dioic acid hydratase in catechol pathway